MRTYVFLLSFIALFGLNATAQQNEILNPQISTLQVKPDDDWLSLPAIRMNGSVKINIDFDELSHEYHRYAYRLEHCEADWTPSTSLFVSDYVDGFAEGNLIEDYQTSLNTNNLYTHYHLSLPNEKCKIKMSGNYRVVIYDDDTSEDVLNACFMVVENIMPVQVGVTTVTDLDFNKGHQQLEIGIDYGTIKITDQRREIQIAVVQNGYWPDVRRGMKPTFVSQDGLAWTHCKDLIFSAGNEYHKFETLQTSNVGLGIEKVDWDGGAYHAYLYADEPRTVYVFDQDANGSFLVRNWDGYDVDQTSEYITMHFALHTAVTDNPIYLDGEWTNHRLLPKYQLHYNTESGFYEATIPLKQGYYSYRYVEQLPSGRVVGVPSEGNFYQTENRYQCFVYYKPIGGRTDRLVGYAQISSSEATK